LAVTLAVPEVEAVKVDVQVAEAVVPANVQVVKIPVTPSSERATAPVGVMKVPGEVSVTVTLHVEPWLTTTGVVHDIVVVVARVTMLVLEAPLLEA
jgi:hypothetical protein